MGLIVDATKKNDATTVTSEIVLLACITRYHEALHQLKAISIYYQSGDLHSNYLFENETTKRAAYEYDWTFCDSTSSQCQQLVKQNICLIQQTMPGGRCDISDVIGCGK